MPSDAVAERLATARRRIGNILRTHSVAGIRTLENKIAEAGPPTVRVEPHHITNALRQLRHARSVIALERHNNSWYTLPDLVPQAEQHLEQLLPIHRELQRNNLVKRVGQALEIAIYRALQTEVNTLDTLGGFLDLNERTDNELYRKEEHPELWRGRRLTRLLDFIIIDRATSIAGGLEAKNTREWIYPTSVEVRELLSKCCTLNLVPILIARRIHFNTRQLLIPRGGLVHETYRQRLPAADAALAARAKDKTLLGYHDIILGNEPDNRLLRFISQLPTLLPRAQERFDEGGRDELCRFAEGGITLKELGFEY